MLSFIEALKTKSSEIQKTREAPKFIPQAPLQVEVPKVVTLRVELVVNRNRIDLFFSDKPEARVLELLKLNGWHFRPSDRAWYHQDNLNNRKFVSQELSNDPSLLDQTYDDQGPAMISSDVEEESKDLPDSFLIYKRQVNDLLAELKIDSADLMLLAISKLHDQIFTKH